MKESGNVKNNTENEAYGFVTVDRIKEYLIPYLDEYVFDELSPAYLEKAGVADILSGVPVPIKKSELTELTNLKITHGMINVIGCDVDFPHRDAYVEYIKRSFGDEIIFAILNEGVEKAVDGDWERACILFRGALLLDPKNQDALYCYGRACKDAYDSGEGEEYVGRFKAESMDVLEKLTILYPESVRGHYYLAYAYMNLGLYTKASLTFKEIISIAEDAKNGKIVIPEEEVKDLPELIADVEGWIKSLEVPIQVEEGYNMVLSGRYPEGIARLTPFTEDERYNTWWPLHYYLGVAHKGLGNYDEAIERFLQVLKLSPSDIMTMEELIDVYSMLGDDEMVHKYTEKIKIVQRNREEERAEKDSSYS